MNGDTSSLRLACSGLSTVASAGSSLNLSPHSFTGLTAPQTKALAEKAHVYMTADGRISMAALNNGNIEYFAESVHKAVKGAL